MRRRSVLTGLASVALACLAADGARAQIVPCPAAPDGFTVFLSEPTYTPSAFATPVEMRSFMQLLQNELDQGRAGDSVESPRINVRFVACKGRVPSPDGQDFARPLVESLYNQRVLLEVWGSLEADSAAAGAPRTLKARMNYLVVPVRYAADRNENAPRGFPRLEYPEPNAPAAADFLDLIARPGDIDAFVAVALGFKLMRERKSEEAYTNLCVAHAMLGTIAARPLRPRSKTDIAALQQLVLSSASRAIENGRAEPGYSETGRLWLFDPAQPCPGRS